MKRWLLKQKLVWKTFGKLLEDSTNIIILFLSFAIILFVLQWLFNLDQLSFILFDAPVPFGEKIRFLIDGFFNIFRFIDDFTPISLILIALLQSFAVIEIRALRQTTATKGSVFSMGLGLIGAGCVACGGSILTPLLAIVATEVSVSVASRISDVILAIAVVLSYKAFQDLALRLAHTKQVGKSEKVS